jgi:hypothetical protein
MLLEQVLGQWKHQVASCEALDVLYQAICTVMYWGIAMAMKIASKVGVFFIGIVLHGNLAAAGAIRSKQLPDGSVQRLPV